MNLWLLGDGWAVGIVREFGIDMYTLLYLKWITRGFPSGAVVKDPPVIAGDTGSSPGPRRSYMLWSN